jgi:hypothetical protein
MHTIPENTMAFDPVSLGFPSIDACQAICLHTSRGLYGFHDIKAASQGRGNMTATEAGTQKLELFANWINGKIQVGENLVAIYGVINQNKQYAASTAGNNEWKAVLLDLADKIDGFSGNVFGGRINNHIGNNESAYVEVNLAGNNCTVSFKRWSKMDEDFDNKVKPQVQDRISFRKTEYKEEPLYGKGLVAPVIRKDANKGFNLNIIAVKKFIVFR